MNTKIWLLDGKVINVGDWDYQFQAEMAETDVEVDVLTEDGKPDKTTVKKVVPTGRQIATNPPPKDSFETFMDITTTAKGRIVLTSDYAALRGAEYPSVNDQLAALWDGGDAADLMKLQIAAIKEKYPKPEGVK